MLKKVSTTQAVKQFSGATGVSHADAKQLLKKGGFKSSMSQEGLEKAVEKSMGIAKKEGIDLKGRNQGVQKQRERISQAIQGDSKGTKAKTTPETEKDKKP